MTTNNTNGNGNGKVAATVAPVKAKAKRARNVKGRSSTPMPVIVAGKARPEKYVNPLGELEAINNPDFKVADFKAIDSATADKNISVIRSSGKKTRRLAHVTAVGILMHYADNGDWSKLTKLDSAIGESLSKQMQRGFRLWVAKYSTVAWRESTDTKGKLTFAGYVDTVKGEGMDAKRFNLTGDKTADEKENRLVWEGALNNPFYSRNFGDTEPTVHTFDAVAEIRKLLAKLEKEMELKRKLVTEKKTRAANKIKLEQRELDAVKNLAKSVFHIKLATATPAGNA